MTVDERPLLDRLRELGPLAVAYSGGVDSALVLAAAARALGPDQVLAVTAVSESLASTELERAAAFAREFGVRHETPRTAELDRPGYRANSRNRCYFCKSEVLDVIGDLARERGFQVVATGTNADDAASRFRPGIRAADERGVHAPLRDTGMTKADVRAVSRRWGLSTWDKPAMPCLASRIRYGVEVSADRLARVDRAEAAVRGLLAVAGVDAVDLRVRDLGDVARVDVDAERVDAVRAVPGLAEAVLAAGFESFAEVRSFQSGVLNIEPVAPQA
ncbi:ATP-dependent sacrificial sulfur transferase LarE [Labedaea rhizosphaerae]|uniref:Asparagine synthetase domain-containing protein n=1 Tax=Labedaea rhizosphaerae TaxID=598644 RepID=A0A4R6S776_LABRH|nr:ATP-dependent sacrificial sulfur transferase LarE [Labedaea rhizosphaerae]TDP95077.1 uncharacterized protein EV186_105309 [Labedaea rhizosphaerae]